MRTQVWNKLMVVAGAIMMLLGGGRLAFGQEADVSSEGITGAIADRSLPPAYKIKGIVRPGEVRSSEFFESANITGNASTSTLQSDKASHAGKFAGVKVYCIGVVAALCQIPPLQKNGQPITDQLVLRGGQVVTLPFNSLVALDTSDSITMNGSSTITGAAGTNVSSVQWEFYTPRSFQPVAGQDKHR